MNILLQGTQSSPGHHALLCALLGAWGYRVQQAAWGEMPSPPLADVVLLDLDGDLGTRLAEAGRWASPPPVLGLCGYCDPDTTLRCTAAGLHSLVAKPVHPATLQAALQDVRPAVLPRFDYAEALTHADAWIVTTIAPQFRQDGPRQWAEWQAAMQTGDCATAQRLAHTLKGLVANFHATPLVRMAHALEGDCADCASPAYQARVAALQVEMQWLDAALAAFCLANPQAG